VRSRNGERALLELTLETGRTHQARVQLAHAGAPIAGDPLYGGAPAPRLLLHAHALTMVHPLTKKRTTFTARAPFEFERWLQRGDEGDRIYDDVAALDAAIRRALERRFALGRSDEDGPRKTTAFRAIHEEGDALPGLAVDVYGEHLVAQFHGDDAIWANRERRERVLDRLDGCIGAAGIYLKVRPRQANTLVETRREDVAPKEPVRGAPAPEVMAIHEEGIAYDVRLGDGLSTGIFLDQRANRVRVRGLAAGARVLNLFSYTCAFSIAAAVGGAKSTVSVDASPAALERGREGLIKLGLLETGEHRFVAEDAFSWLARGAKKPERFDLVIVDPPSYSVTKSRRFVAATDYGELVAAAIGVCAPRARLLASTNHRGISRQKLRKAVADGVRRAGRSAAQIKDLPESADFPAPIGGEPYMKAVLVTLAD
jgi:23S rRNA (cytosine1962-C5)-methyltransferase